MLSPEQIETAGDAVAAVYNDIEAKMLDHLVIALINVEELDQMTMTELNLLAQSHTQQLRDYINDEREVIAAGVRETAERLKAARFVAANAKITVAEAPAAEAEKPAEDAKADEN